MMSIEMLLGKTLYSVERIGDEKLVFMDTEGNRYEMCHFQDCRETVEIEDIVGDLDDLVGHPILRAEEAESGDSLKPDMEYDSFTWTFYKLATIKGYVDIRWFGSSNGYYSESVAFYKVA